MEDSPEDSLVEAMGNAKDLEGEDNSVIRYMPIPEIHDDKAWTYDEAAFLRGEGLCAIEMSPISDTSPDLSKARVFFMIGGPGSGKSTMAAMLASEYGFVHIVPHNVVGRLEFYGCYEAWKIIRDQEKAAGGVLPDHWMCLLLKMEIHKHMEAGAGRFLIEGFPSTVEQFEDFRQTFGETLAIGLQVSADTMEKRYMDVKMTFDYGERRHQEFQARKMSFFENDSALRLHPRFRSNTVWVNAEHSPADAISTLRGIMDHVLLGLEPIEAFANSRILPETVPRQESSSREETGGENEHTALEDSNTEVELDIDDDSGSR
ncbi:hypothetical protein FE257_002626 [Aspergillus nanangensis]|uniref:Uncharacterized protein n=1 Tax=Aspergillus nanangensis TaxID=2582783 RepID=A0AAD4CCH6_ASPNN|nr:hypothetical protein FE257_002626 [Aspergillus nanangensis]